MTKDTEKAFVIIYSEYLRRRKFGTSKTQALRFEYTKILSIEAFSSWDAEDIRYSLRELKKLGHIQMDIFGEVQLSQDGIQYMESRPREYFQPFAGAITDLLSLVAAFLSI